MSVLFSQSCPTCGRRIEVRTSLLGQVVACQHCQAEFVADPHADLETSDNGEDELMRRVEQALQRSQAAMQRSASIGGVPAQTSPTLP